MKKLWQNYTVETICLHCDKKFQCFVHNLRKGFGKYCSKACSNSAKPRGFQKGHGNLRNRRTPIPARSIIYYQRLHNWVEKHLGKPEKCWHCKKDGLVGRKIHWASKSRRYKWDLKDWLRLCAKCHAKYDG